MAGEDTAETFAKTLLLAIRRVIDSSELNYDKLPRWTRAANIRIGQIENSTIIFFERTPQEVDEVIERRDVQSDVEFVFPKRTSSCEEVMFDLSDWDEDKPGLSVVSNLTLSISSPNQCFSNAGRDPRHISLALYNVQVQYKPKDQLKSTRYIPFALFISKEYTSDFDLFWENCGETLMESIATLHGSPRADYKSEPMSEKGIMTSIEDTVIILGNYDKPYESELRQIRDYLIRLGYDSFLIKDLPENPEMSLEEKVKLWTTASRFCIMVDREASGHIKEYEIVKAERKPLLLLRPEDTGSTWMIGDDELIDLNYIKTFEFEESPLEEVEKGIRWAEDLLNKRGKEYPEFYPWKNSD